MLRCNIPDMLRVAAKEVDYPLQYLTDEYLHSLVDDYQNDPNKFCTFSEHGLLTGLITTNYTSLPNIPVAVETIWWVHPDHRGKAEGKKMYDCFIEWAKLNGCKYVLQAKPTGTYIKKTEIYLREID